MTVDYISSLHLLGRGLDSTGQIDRYPAMGMIPTSRWQTGEIYRDLYHIYANETAVSPAKLQVAVSLYDDEADQTLKATNVEGIPIDPVFVGSPVRLNGKTDSLPEMDIATYAHFEQGITLLGIDGVEGTPGDTIPLTLYWQATSTPDSEYTIFVHLLNQAGERIAGADAPPAANFYPTSMWRSGDLIDDMHLLALPDDLAPGVYKINVGLYDPLTGARISRADGSGDYAEFSFDVIHE